METTPLQVGRGALEGGPGQSVAVVVLWPLPALSFKLYRDVSLPSYSQVPLGLLVSSAWRLDPDLSQSWAGKRPKGCVFRLSALLSYCCDPFLGGFPSKRGVRLARLP